LCCFDPACFDSRAKEGEALALLLIDFAVVQWCTAAIAVQDFSVREIVDSILRAYGNQLDSDFIEASRQKVSRYIETLASTGERDPEQLTTYGVAYLNELRNPDPRYSGC
jgi:hypothetical protein